MEGLTTAVHWEVESLISYVDFGEEEIMHNVITFMGKILIFSVGTKNFFFPADQISKNTFSEKSHQQLDESQRGKIPDSTESLHCNCVLLILYLSLPFWEKRERRGGGGVKARPQSAL